MKNKKVVIKKDGKYYNTLTKRFVSENYANRINSYFKRNPNDVLIRATGHGVLRFEKKTRKTKIKGKVAYRKVPKETIELSKRKTILIKSKTISGKEVFYSPKYDEIVRLKAKRLRAIDYKNKMWNVSLYRKSLDNLTVYHILDLKIDEDINSEIDIAQFMGYFFKEVLPVLRYELINIYKNHTSDKMAYVYGKLSSTIYSEIDYFPMNSSFGFIPFVRTNEISEFINIIIREINKFMNKIKSFSYHSLHFDRLTIYISQNIDMVNFELIRYREGVENIRF